MTKLLEREISQRRFPEWNMGMVNMNDAEADPATQSRLEHMFEPDNLEQQNAQSAFDLLLGFIRPSAGS